jgi:hypothetical protein
MEENKYTFFCKTVFILNNSLSLFPQLNDMFVLSKQSPFRKEGEDVAEQLETIVS